MKNNEIDVSWIPEKFAKLNRSLRLKINGVWDNLWIVKEVSSISFDEKYILERSQDYKNTRKASDI